MSPKPEKPVKTGDTIDLPIAALVFGGEAIGRHEGFTVFVPGALPGEKARVKVVQVKDNYARGEIVDLIEASPDRTAPECPIFSECGGCQWQQIEYNRQLQTKRQFVSDALERIGHFKGLTVQPCLPSPDRYAYRNKALPVLSMRDGHFVSGIYEPRTHRLVPYVSCPIQTEPINQLIQRTLKKVELAGLTPYQEKPHIGFLRHLAVRHGNATGEILLSFVTRTEVPTERLHRSTLLPESPDAILPRIAEELMRETPNLVGVLQNVNSARTNLVLGPVTKTLGGRAFYHEVIDGLLLKVSLQSFLQVNSKQAEILHAVVREALGRPADPRKRQWGTVLDLYSGIGTLALAVSQRADYVMGVEEIGAAVADAQENAKLNHRANVDFVEGDVGAALLHLKGQGLDRVDAVLLDPPRKGVLPEVLARVTALHPERLVYVSCDPATLSRDLELLSRHGFSVDWVQPLDMFPQTYHVETVVRLTRNTPGPAEVPPVAGEEAREPFRLKSAMEKAGSALEPLAPPLRDAARMAAQQLRAALQGMKVVGKLLLVSGAAIAVRTGQVCVLGFKAASQAAGRMASIPYEKGLRAYRRWQDSRETKRFVPPPPPLAEPLPVETIEPPDFLDASASTVEERPEEVIAVVPIVEEPSTEVPATPPETIDPVTAAGSSWTEVPATVEGSGITETPVTMEPVPIEREVREALMTPGEPVRVEVPVTVEKTAETHMPSWTPERPVPTRRPSLLVSVAKSRWTGFFLLAFFLTATGVYIARATLTPPLPAGVPQVLPDLIAVMPSRTFLRYEMIPFDVRLGREDRPHLRRMTAVVEIFREGQRVEGVDGLDRLVLKHDFRNDRFVGNWPIPYNAPAGTYLTRLTLQSPQWAAPRSFESAFTIPSHKPMDLPKGFSVLTMEGGKSDREGRRIPPVTGPERSSAESAIGWAKFMGADAFYYLVGQTAIWGKRKANEYPFSEWDRKTARRYGKAAHEAGLKFGAYVTAFKVVGDGWEQADYEYSTGYDAKKDVLMSVRHISLDDPKRRRDLVDLLRDLESDPQVDLIGFDYLRLGFGGYEMVEEMVKNLNIPVPPEYLDWTREERMLWLARIYERPGNARIKALFNWWRAHRMAGTVRDILKEVRPTKPVFAFTLGWEMGHQHGQDPAMFMDAGLSFVQIMLYESTREHIQSMKRHWPPYLARGNGSYVLGEMVDFNWVQNTVDPPGPQELHDRQVEMFDKWHAVNADLGMFWHDMYRLIWGFQGPYSRMEWVVSGAASFSRMREACGTLPFELKMTVPSEAPQGATVPFTVEIRNRTPADLKGLKLTVLDTSRDVFAQVGKAGPFDLQAGTQTKFENLTVRLPREENEERDDRYMVAVLVEKEGSGNVRNFGFSYIKALSSEEAQSGMDVAP